jgi:hypothetical protein
MVGRPSREKRNGHLFCTSGKHWCPEHEFRIRNKITGTRTSQCKECHNTYKRLIERVRANVPTPVIKTSVVKPSTNFWTGSRNKQLKTLYKPTTPKDILLEAFAPKSWAAIRSQAQRLGLPGRINRRDWATIAETYIATHDMLVKPTVRKDDHV